MKKRYRRERKLDGKRDILANLLEKRNVEIKNPLDHSQVFAAAVKHFYGREPENRSYSPEALHTIYSSLIRRILGSAPMPVLLDPDPDPVPAPVRVDHCSKEQKSLRIASFYASYQWRKVRYQALMLHGFKCLACGRSAAQGAVIHVDHKKPLRKYWHLRLDPENLQPLCDWCNHGKGNWDETDFTKDV